MEIYRVAFIGHREVDEHRQVADELDTVLSMLLKKHEYIEFYVGKNGEFDELAASAVRRLKSEWAAFCSLALVLPYGKAFVGIHQSDERQIDNHRFERRLTNRRKT